MPVSPISPKEEVSMRFRFARYLTGPVIAGTSAALVVAGLGAAGATGAFAAAASSSATALPAGSLHGCVQGSSRILEHVYTSPGSGLTCPAGSFQVVWQQKGAAGAQGPAGPAGPAGPQGPAGPAGSAGASDVVSATASTTITNWPESSGWAADAFTRTLTETVDHAAASAKCGGTPQCWFVTGEITDNGTFQTVAGAQSPNGSSSAKVAGVLDGTIQGTATFEFYSSSSKLAASSVPVSATGAAKPASTTDWGELGFPSGTTFAGVALTAYDWIYVAPSTCEQWNDQVNPGDDGQGAADGNVTGVNNCKS
jgi:hypothetical protein